MKHSEILVERISSLCEERGISYYKLEELSGVSLSTIDNIIKGKTKDPRITTLHKIALGFDINISEFLDIKELNNFSFDES